MARRYSSTGSVAAGNAAPLAIARSNLPKGALTSETLASTVVGHAAERAWLPFVVPRSALVRGSYVVAFELHQASAESSDATLDARIEGKR